MKKMKKMILALVLGIICTFCFARVNTNVATYNESSESFMFVINDTAILYRNVYLIEVRAENDVETKVVKIPTHREFMKGATIDTIQSGFGSFTVNTCVNNCYVLYSSKPFNEAHSVDGNYSLYSSNYKK